MNLTANEDEVFGLLGLDDAGKMLHGLLVAFRLSDVAAHVKKRKRRRQR